MTNLRRFAFTAAMLAVLAAATACDRDSTSRPDRTTPGPAPTGSPVETATSEALAAYRGMWDAFVEAAKTADSTDPRLRQHAQGDALALIVGSLTTDRNEGKVTLGRLSTAPRVMSATPEADPTTVTVGDCVDSTHWLVYWSTGGLVDDKPGGRHDTTATVVRTPDGWQVSAFTLRVSGTC